LKRIVIDVTPSLDPRQGDQLTWRAEGIDGPLDILQLLQSVQAHVVQQMAQAEMQARAQAQRQAAVRNGHRVG